MSAFGQARQWLRSVVFRRRTEREMHAEMLDHIEQAAARYLSRGMTEGDAMHAARREFGNVAHIQEESRDSRGGRWVEQTLGDMRYAVRYFARTPLTTLTIVLTLTLAVGGNAALYSVMHGMAFNPPPGIADDPSLVVIRGSHFFERNRSIRYFAFRELLEYGRLPELNSVAGYYQRSGVVDFGDGAEGIGSTSVTFVTPNFFQTLQIPFVAGSGFIASRLDDYQTTELTAVVSHALASRKFGVVANAIGRSVRVDDVVVTIVGVTPPRFSGVSPAREEQAIFLPVSSLPAVARTSAAVFASLDSTKFQAVGRLADDASRKQASLAAHHVASINAGRLRQPGDTERDLKRLQSTTTDVVRLRGNWRSLKMSGEDMAGWAAALMFDLIIVLVCATTVSSLLIGSAIARRHEIGVRLSLGAARSRIVRQLLTESTLLAFAGGASGLLLFAAALRLFASRWFYTNVTPDWSVALFTAAFAMLTALVCGMSPALHATRNGLSDVLKESSLGATPRSKLQRTFVVAQIALAQPLLVALGTFGVMVVSELGLQTGAHLEDRLLVATVDQFAYKRLTGDYPRLDDLIERLRGTPGVYAVTKFAGANWASDGILEPILSGAATATAAERFRVEQRGVSPEYFEALDIPILRGRGFTLADTMQKSVPAVVSTKFAAKFLEGGEAIGRRFRLGHGRSEMTDEVLTIVGVVDAASVSGSAHHIFVPLRYSESLLIRTAVPAEPMIGTIRGIIKSELPRLPVTSLQSVARMNRESENEMLQLSSAAASGGVITLLLGCVGLYAVVALAVGQRKREIGIRIALGAKPSQVVHLFFRSGLRLSLIGLAIGLPLSAAVLRVVMTQFGAIQIGMVAVAASVGATVVAVASVATWLPARRAAGVDPVITLRSE